MYQLTLNSASLLLHDFQFPIDGFAMQSLVLAPVSLPVLPIPMKFNISIVLDAFIVIDTSEKHSKYLWLALYCVWSICSRHYCSIENEHVCCTAIIIDVDFNIYAIMLPEMGQKCARQSIRHKPKQSTLSLKVIWWPVVWPLKTKLRSPV